MYQKDIVPGDQETESSLIEPETANNTNKDESKLPDEIELVSLAGGCKYLIKQAGSETGVYYSEPGKKDNPVLHFLCSVLLVVALFRDIKNTGWGRVLKFCDFDGHEHEFIMNASNASKDGDAIIGDLRSLGITVTAHKRLHSYLVDYVLNTKPAENRRIRSTDKTGWQGKTLFMAQNTAIGKSDEEYRYDGKGHHQPFSVSGTLPEWQENVGRYCIGNPILLLCASMSFAATLLYMLEMENGGFNLMGESSIGKSTAMKVSAGIIGNPAITIQRWNATTNAMEGIASAYNDILLPLDEIAQATGHEIGNTVYMLGNGMGKGRMQSGGDLRKRTTFRCLFLSNGERSLEAHMDEAGKSIRAGQEVRLVDLNADMGLSLGIYTELHGFNNSYELNEFLVANSMLYYGVPILEFLSRIVGANDDFILSMQSFIDDFINENVKADADGQVKRIAKRFALVACGGELASQFGITGWQEGVASEAALTMFKRWLDDRGNSGKSEGHKLVAQVRQFFENHSESRFSLLKPDAHDNSRPVSQRVGFKHQGTDGDEYYVLPESFKLICQGFPLKQAIKTLTSEKLLKVNREGHAMHSQRVPGFRNPKKVYIFTSNVLADQEETQPASNTNPLETEKVNTPEGTGGTQAQSS